MPSEDDIHDVSQRLIACDDDAEVRILAQKLRRLLHESTEEARSQIQILPDLQKHAKRRGDS
jgi:hypothetical protein